MVQELKTFTSERIYWAVEQVEREAGDIDNLHLDDNSFYLKSEADKVIAELKEIDSKNRSAYYKDLAMMAKDVEHDKYKRCLAMAKICEDKLGTVVKPGWWNKWYRRWLELAEKFKEVR